MIPAKIIPYVALLPELVNMVANLGQTVQRLAQNTGTHAPELQELEVLNQKLRELPDLPAEPPETAHRSKDA